MSHPLQLFALYYGGLCLVLIWCSEFDQHYSHIIQFGVFGKLRGRNGHYIHQFWWAVVGLVLKAMSTLHVICLWGASDAHGSPYQGAPLPMWVSLQENLQVDHLSRIEVCQLWQNQLFQGGLIAGCFHFRNFMGSHFCKKVCHRFFIPGCLIVGSIALETQRRQDLLL